MATGAFEAITTRVAWHASEAIEKYDAAEIGADGRFQKADGSGIFYGIVQYGAESEDDMCTVVQGIFPGKVSADVEQGSRVKVDTTKPGLFVAALAADDAVGVALMDITKGATGSILLVPSVGSGA